MSAEHKTRTNRIVSRLSCDELAALDSRRGKCRRGAFLRIAALGRVPRHVPHVNQDTARDLSRALGNLATVATAMRGGHYAELETVRRLVAEVGAALRGIRFEDGDDEPEALSLAIAPPTEIAEIAK
jgi:hypothetical protein